MGKALVAGPYTALTVVGTMAGIAVALPLGASAVAIARTHVFPVWMAWSPGWVRWSGCWPRWQRRVPRVPSRPAAH